MLIGKRIHCRTQLAAPAQHFGDGGRQLHVQSPAETDFAAPVNDGAPGAGHQPDGCFFHPAFQPHAEIGGGGGELGPAMDSLSNEHNTKQKQGAIGILTAGLSSRQAAYEQLVAMAAAPFVTNYFSEEK